jgi:hypothetical protein
LLATIPNPVPAANDNFGSVAGVGTNQFVVGALNKTIGGHSTAGQAYLYGTTVFSFIPGLIADGVAPNSIGLPQLNLISVDARYVLKTGDTITGPLNVLAALTASSFIGNGSGLTNIPTSSVANFLTAVTNVATNVVTTATNSFMVTATNIANASALAATNAFGKTVAVSLTNAANSFTGTFTGLGSSLTNALGQGFVGTNYGRTTVAVMTNGANVFAGSLIMPTNAAAPTVVAGYGYFWASNYNLYWVTPTKTNLIVVGQ